VLEPSATNGEEALALIDSLKPDVVLLDIACRAWMACRSPPAVRARGAAGGGVLHRG
jgi:CheY-like chemotaxis protein